MTDSKKNWTDLAKQAPLNPQSDKQTHAYGKFPLNLKGNSITRIRYHEYSLIFVVLA